VRSWFALLLLLAVACVAAFTWQWLAADPGYVLVRYGGTSIETTLIFAVFALLVVWGVLRLAWRLLRAPLAAWSQRRRRRGRERIAGGLVALAEGRYTHALRELERASHQSGLQAPALLAAARAAQARGDAERASALLARAPEGAALVLNARFQLEQRRPDAALALLKPQLEKSTLPPAGWPLLAEAALRSGDAATAFAALPELARAQVLSPQAFVALETRVLAATLLAAPDRDRLTQLWSNLGKAQRRRPEAVAAYAQRAAQLGQILAGIGEIEAALRREWSESLIVRYGELGPAEAEARLRYAEGWISAQPNSAGLALTLGRLCILCKLWGKARGYLERGLEIEPSPALWEALGDCHAGRDDSAAAGRCWRNAVLAARGEATQPLPQATAATALSTRAAVVEERSEHGVPRLPGVAR
jgi:HemY protein